MPRGIPSSRATPVETTMRARVAMLSSHSPSRPSSRVQPVVRRATRRLAMRWAMRKIAATRTGQGSQKRAASALRIRPSMPSLRGLKA